MRKWCLGDRKGETRAGSGGALANREIRGACTPVPAQRLPLVRPGSSQGATRGSPPVDRELPHPHCGLPGGRRHPCAAPRGSLPPLLFSSLISLLSMGSAFTCRCHRDPTLRAAMLLQGTAHARDMDGAPVGTKNRRAKARLRSRESNASARSHRRHRENGAAEAFLTGKPRRARSTGPQALQDRAAGTCQHQVQERQSACADPVLQYQILAT